MLVFFSPFLYYLDAFAEMRRLINAYLDWVWPSEIYEPFRAFLLSIIFIDLFDRCWDILFSLNRHMFYYR